MNSDDLEDGFTHSGISHSTNGTRHCHTCGETGRWHMPQDCPAASRVCRQCSQMGHLAKACPIGTHLTIPQLKLAETTNKVNPHSAYGSDTESSVGTKSLATADSISTTGSSDSSWYGYAESHTSQDSIRSQKRQATYEEIGRIINIMNDHNRPHASQEDISMLGELDTSLLA